MKVTDLTIDAFTVGQVSLAFETEPKETTGYNFVIVRGHGRGKSSDLSDAIKVGETKSTQFLDRTPVDIGLLRRISYWIEVHRDDGNGTDVTERIEGPFYPGHRIPAIAAEIIRRLTIMLRHGGTIAAIHTLQPSKKRCPTCWDEIKKNIRFSDCGDCFGTAILDGFGGPFVARIMMNPPAESNTPAEHGEQETVTNQLLMGPFPRLQPKDIIRTVDGTIWRVINVTPTEYKQVLVQQNANVYALEKSNSAYKLPVPDKLKEYDPTRIELNQTVVEIEL